MGFDPYLHFQGQCEAAMNWYMEVFDGSDLFLMRYGEAPGADPGPGSDLIMHASFRVGEGQLMASDFPPGQAGDAQTAVSISHGEPTRAQAQAIFDRLCEGGEVIMPFAETFWADGFGMVKDRFGTHWMIGGPPKPMEGMPG